MLRSPWLGVLAVAVAGIVGYALSDGHAGARTLASVTVTIRPARDTGAGWDFGGGAPDPRWGLEAGAGGTGTGTAAGVDPAFVVLAG